MSVFRASALALLMAGSAEAVTNDAYFANYQECVYALNGESKGCTLKTSLAYTGAAGTTAQPNLKYNACENAKAALNPGTANGWSAAAISVAAKVYVVKRGFGDVDGEASPKVDTNEDTQQPGGTKRGYGQWIDPESQICSKTHTHNMGPPVVHTEHEGRLGMVFNKCFGLNNKILPCGPHSTGTSAALTGTMGDDHDCMGAGCTVAQIAAKQAVKYSLCGVHQIHQCEDTIYDTAFVLFLVICCTSLIIIFFQCSLMGLYDLLVNNKGSAAAGPEAP